MAPSKQAQKQAQSIVTGSAKPIPIDLAALTAKRIELYGLEEDTSLFVTVTDARGKAIVNNVPMPVTNFGTGGFGYRANVPGDKIGPNNTPITFNLAVYVNKAGIDPFAKVAANAVKAVKAEKAENALDKARAWVASLEAK